MQDDITWGVKYLVKPGHRRPEAGRRSWAAPTAATRRSPASPSRPTSTPRRVVDRRPVEPHHAARVDPALLGGDPDHLPRADGQPEHARGQGSARAAVAAQLRRRRSRRRSSSSRARTTRASRRPSRSRSSSRCATAASRSSTSCAPDEGHGFARPVNNMALLAASRGVPRASTSAAASSRAGRPRSSTRLKEITVDPKTVVLAKKVDTAAVGAPKPVADLAAGQRRATQGTIAAGGADHADVDHARRQGGGRRPGSSPTPRRCRWARRSTSTTVDKGTLVPVKRVHQAGPGRDRPRVRGRQGDRHDGDGRRAEAGLRRPRRRALRRRRRRPRLDRPRCRSPRATATTFRNFDVQKQKVAAEAGEGDRRRGGHGRRPGRSRRGRSRSPRPRASPARRRSGSRRTPARS